MPRATPRSLSNEIAASRGSWRLYGARFIRKGVPNKAIRGVKVDHVWVELDAGRIACSMQFSGRSTAQLRALARAAQRTGYSVATLKGWLFVRRVVRASELAAEMGRISAVTRDPASLASFPSRSPRVQSFSRALFPREVFARVRRARGWQWEWAGASRRGTSSLVDKATWIVSTWCSLLRADGETRLDVGVSLGPRLSRSARVDADAQRRARGALGARLSPFGYRELKFKRRGKRPTGCMLLKTLRGLAAARRERERLDQLVFGE